MRHGAPKPGTQRGFVLIAVGCLVPVVVVILLIVLVVNSYIRIGQSQGERVGDTALRGGVGGQSGCVENGLQVIRNNRDILRKIAANVSVYRAAASRHNLPWEMLAGIHYREHNSDPSNPSNGQGPYQLESLHGQITSNGGKTSFNGRTITLNDIQDFAKASEVAALFLQYGVDNKLSDNPADGLVKEAFLKYNAGKGSNANPDRSSYVMNNFDDDHRNMRIRGTVDHGRVRVDTVDARDGAFTVYYLLHYMADVDGGNITFKDCTAPESASGGAGGAVVYNGAKACPTKNGTTGWGPVTKSNPHQPTYPGHEGLDIFAAEGTPIYSITEGTVIKRGWSGGYRVMIDDGQGHYWFYQHMLSNLQVRVGDKVKPGDLLGYMSNSGAEHSDVHLHLGIAKNRNPQTNGGELRWQDWFYPYDFVHDIPCVVKNLRDR